MKKSKIKFAETAWTASDVKSIPGRARKMTIRQAEEFLARNENRLRDRLIEYGWEVIELLLVEEG